MSTTHNKQLVLRWKDEIWNKRNLNIVDELYAPDRLISLFKLHDELDVALSQLPLRERQILELRFGLSGENQTLEEVGKKLRVSRERIRQLEKRGLERLRRLAQRMGIV